MKEIATDARSTKTPVEVTIRYGRPITRGAFIEAWSQQFSNREIGRIFDVSSHDVTMIRRRFGLAPRDPSFAIAHQKAAAALRLPIRQLRRRKQKMHGELCRISRPVVNLGKRLGIVHEIVAVKSARVLYFGNRLEAAFATIVASDENRKRRRELRRRICLGCHKRPTRSLFSRFCQTCRARIRRQSSASVYS